MIIGLVGFKQVGKSTAAKYLEKKYGFTRHNFKDALVQEIKDNFPDLLTQIVIAGRDLGFKAMNWNELFEEKPPLMRALMQNYGTDVRREDESDYWTNKWQHTVLNTKTNIVCDDIRFLNEVGAVKDAGHHRGEGVYIIRIVRTDILTGDTHISETEQLEIVADHTIECDPGDHAALYQALDDIIKQ